MFYTILTYIIFISCNDTLGYIKSIATLEIIE